MSKTFAIESVFLAIVSFIFFLFGIFESSSQVAAIFGLIVGIMYILVRLIWLFHAYVIFKSNEWCVCCRNRFVRYQHILHRMSTPPLLKQTRHFN